MKKSMVLCAVSALAVTTFAMSNSTADAKAPANAQAVPAVKPAACPKGCTCKACQLKADASKSAGDMKAGVCPACKTAGGMCPACKAKSGAAKATKDAAGCTDKAAGCTDKAVKDAGCPGGVCPLKK